MFCTRKFTFQSASSFHVGPCFSADWGEMTCDVNSRTHAFVSYTVHIRFLQYGIDYTEKCFQQQQSS